MKRKAHPVPFAGCFAPDPASRKRAWLVFAGLPTDSQSSFLRGAAHAPRRIRLAYDGNCYNSSTESGVDLAGRVADLGDVRPASTWYQTQRRYQAFAASLFCAGKVPFFAGGDHAITVPLVAALAALGRPLHVVQFDAHPDLYPAYEGRRDSHACVAARLLEMKHVASVTQLGLRADNAIQAATARRFGARVRQFHAKSLTGKLPRLPHLKSLGLVYLTVDLDAFDPAFAPGVSHPVPGGLTPRQVLNFIQEAAWNLVGMDVVEVNPARDVGDRTAILAARLLHEGMGLAWKRKPRRSAPR